METRRILNDVIEALPNQITSPNITNLRMTTLGGLALALTACAEPVDRTDFALADAERFLIMDQYPNADQKLDDSDGDGFLDWYEEQEGSDPNDNSSNPTLMVEKLVACDEIIATNTDLETQTTSMSVDCIDTNSLSPFEMETGRVHLMKFKNSEEGAPVLGVEAHTGFYADAIYTLNCGTGDEDWIPQIEDCRSYLEDESWFYFVTHMRSDLAIFENFQFDGVRNAGYEYDDNPNDDTEGFETSQNIDSWTFSNVKGEYQAIGIYYEPQLWEKIDSLNE